MSCFFSRLISNTLNLVHTINLLNLRFLHVHFPTDSLTRLSLMISKLLQSDQNSNRRNHLRDHSESLNLMFLTSQFCQSSQLNTVSQVTLYFSGHELQNLKGCFLIGCLCFTVSLPDRKNRSLNPVTHFLLAGWDIY